MPILDMYILGVERQLMGNNAQVLKYLKSMSIDIFLTKRLGSSYLQWLYCRSLPYLNLNTIVDTVVGLACCWNYCMMIESL